MVLWRVWHGYPDKKVWTGSNLHPGFSGLGFEWRIHSMTCLVPIILVKVAVVSIGTAGISPQGLFHFSVLRNWNLARCLLATVCLYFVIQMQINKSLSVNKKCGSEITAFMNVREDSSLWVPWAFEPCSFNCVLLLLLLLLFNFLLISCEAPRK